MGTNRTAERHKAKKAAREERRRQVKENNARLSAECQARYDAIREAYRKTNPGKHEYTLYFRRNKLGTLDFSNPEVPYDPEDPEKGIVEKTAEINAAFEKAAKNPC